MTKYKKVLKKKAGYTYKHPKTGKKINVGSCKQHYRVKRYHNITKKETLPKNIPNKILDERNAEMVRESKYGEDLGDSFPEGSYLYHGTSEGCLKEGTYEKGVLQDRELSMEKSIDQEDAIFFTTTLDDAQVYGNYVIAFPIDALREYKILKNTHGNSQEDLSVMIKEDVDLSKDTLIYSRIYGWMGLEEAYNKLNMPDWMPEEDLEEDPEEIQEKVTYLNKLKNK